MTKTFIIAEAGVNHNGNFKLALKMIDKAKNFGADAIKFQIFDSNKLATKKADLANYQKKIKNKFSNQQEMLKKLSLKKSDFLKLKKHCKRKKIKFLCTPFDEESLKFLIKIGVKTIKIASGEITNIPLLRTAGKLADNVIFSTGMASPKEIEHAFKILTKSGLLSKNITILHCTTDYPAPLKDLNLNYLKYLKKKFKTKIGYSDHTIEKNIPITAVAIGAEVIEKHFTLSRKMKGPDHQASITPNEFKSIISEIRKTEMALGQEKKIISREEKRNIKKIRKSIFAKKNILKGEYFTINNLITKRPGTGLNAVYWDKVIGKKAIKQFKENEKIKIK